MSTPSTPLPPPPSNSDRWGPPLTGTPNSATPFQFGSSPPHSSSPPPPQTLSVPIISPILVDKIARDFQLEPKQHQNLRLFVQFGSLGMGLSLPDLATRLFMLASQYGEAAERHRAENAEAKERMDWRAMWRDLKIRLEETFCFTREQKKNIRGVVQDTIYEGTRTKFLTMHVDVLVALEKRKELLSLDNIYGVPGREKSLSQMTKRQCSSVRNGWRADVISSIDPKNFIPLADFVFASATKYKAGGPGEELPQIYTVHAVLLRRFVFDNPSLKGLPVEEEEPDSDVEYDQAELMRPKKRQKKAPARRGGKIARGDNLWGRMDEWFRKEVESRGMNLTSPKWKTYVDQLIVDDGTQFLGMTPGDPVSSLETLPTLTMNGAAPSQNLDDLIPLPEYIPASQDEAALLMLLNNST
ncbi:hypothetical protein C8R43DRAFT_1135417 [Mycena crocata]|nr:hypothetical protein C8R43DRAFT_1135417 [Mycena crocata]